MKNKKRVSGTDFTQSVPPRSGLVQLLSDTADSFGGVFSSSKKSLRRKKSAAVSFYKARPVNLFARQTLPVGRCIQISARGVAR